MQRVRDHPLRFEELDESFQLRQPRMSSEWHNLQANEQPAKISIAKHYPTNVVTISPARNFRRVSSRHCSQIEVEYPAALTYTTSRSVDGTQSQRSNLSQA